MRLQQIVEELVLSRPLSLSTQNNYRRAVRYFENFIGRQAVLADLTNVRVNAWLSSLEPEYDSAYVRNLRRDLLVVWNFAADCEHCTHPKTRLIRAIRKDKRTPESWPIEWIPRLIEACGKFRGCIRKTDTQRSWYLEAYLRVQADLLCRPTDMRQLRWSQIEPDGYVTFTQHKTNVEHRGKLSRESIRALNRIRGTDGIYCFTLTKSSTEKMIRKLFRLAEIEKPRKQSLGHLRHTGGTAIALVSGNDAARAALGHTPGSRVFEAHYLDRSKSPAVNVAGWWK